MSTRKCVKCPATDCVLYSRTGPVCAAHTGYDGSKLAAVQAGARCPFLQGSIRYHAWWDEYLSTQKKEPAQ